MSWTLSWKIWQFLLGRVCFFPICVFMALATEAAPCGWQLVPSLRPNQGNLIRLSAAPKSCCSTVEQSQVTPAESMAILFPDSHLQPLLCSGIADVQPAPWWLQGRIVRSIQPWPGSSARAAMLVFVVLLHPAPEPNGLCSVRLLGCWGAAPPPQSMAVREAGLVCSCWDEGWAQLCLCP